GEGPGALEALPWTREWYRDLERILLVGMGTARHAGLVAQEALRRLTGLSVEAMYAAAFRDGEGSPLPPGTLVVAISQSGETADTWAAVERAQDMSLPVLAVTNVVDSTLARRADAVLYTQAGLEVAVPSTKAYLAQLACLYALALHMGR